MHYNKWNTTAIYLLNFKYVGFLKRKLLLLIGYMSYFTCVSGQGREIVQVMKKHNTRIQIFSTLKS